MRTDNLSFHLEKTFPATFVLQGWCAGILTGFVFTLGICLYEQKITFFQAIGDVAPGLMIVGSIGGVIKGTVMWAVYRLTKIQVGSAARVAITSSATCLLTILTGLLLDNPFLVESVLAVLVAGLPTAILVGSSVKPWQLFTFGSIDVGLDRSGSKSVLGTLGTLPLRFLSLFALASWFLYVASEFEIAKWRLDYILGFLIPTGYLLFSAYVTFRSPHKIILFITGLGANIPVAVTAFFAYAINASGLSDDAFYVSAISGSFVIAWVVFLVARLSVRTRTVAMPLSILSNASPTRDKHLEHQCLGSRFLEWQQRHA